METDGEKVHANHLRNFILRNMDGIWRFVSLEIYFLARFSFFFFYITLDVTGSSKIFFPNNSHSEGCKLAGFVAIHGESLGVFVSIWRHAHLLREELD